jgi:hypothetical protein
MAKSQTSSYDAKKLYNDLKKRLEALETLWPELKGQALAFTAGVQAGVKAVVADTRKVVKRRWSKAQRAAAAERMRAYHAARKKAAGRKK